MKRMAQRMGPNRFHRPLRSSCIDMAISRAPSKNRVCTQKEGRKEQASHAEDGDPDGTDGTEEVAVLQGVVVHDAQNGCTWLIAGVVELQEDMRELRTRKMWKLLGGDQDENGDKYRRSAVRSGAQSVTEDHCEEHQTCALWSCQHRIHPSYMFY